jgi:hypothetical protein
MSWSSPEKGRNPVGVGYLSSFVSRVALTMLGQTLSRVALARLGQPFAMRQQARWAMGRMARRAFRDITEDLSEDSNECCLTRVGAHCVRPTLSRVGAHCVRPILSRVGAYCVRPILSRVGAHCVRPILSRVGAHCVRPTLRYMMVGPLGQGIIGPRGLMSHSEGLPDFILL